jgi:hypothetical protein
VAANVHELMGAALKGQAAYLRVIKITARQEVSEDHLWNVHFLGGVQLNWDASAIVFDADGILHRVYIDLDVAHTRFRGTVNVICGVYKNLVKKLKKCRVVATVLKLHSAGLLAHCPKLLIVCRCRS